MRPCLTLLLALGACKDPSPPVSGCQPLLNECRGQELWICSPQQRWRLEMNCAEVNDGGFTCHVSDAGRAACLP